MADATQKITRNLGGDRLGSGNKMQIDMHAYNRSTHDLSRAWRSSMNVGTLVPFLHEVALNGDTWSIDLEALVRTIPTIGPLYGSYKLQLDVFSCPIRLYNGLLHNNMVNIGLKMGQVKLPKVEISTIIQNPLNYVYEKNQSQISATALINYLGVTGIADLVAPMETPYAEVGRKFNAVPVLAYYDIYKNYYANKQEGVGVIITAKGIETQRFLKKITVTAPFSGNTQEYKLKLPNASEPPQSVTPSGDTYQESEAAIYLTEYAGYEMQVPDEWNLESAKLVLQQTIESGGTTAVTYFQKTLADTFPALRINGDKLYLGTPDDDFSSSGNTTWEILGVTYDINLLAKDFEIELTKFALENIDQAKIDILKATGLNSEVLLNQMEYYPYAAIYETDDNDITASKRSQQGLALKTYQSDIYNNWLQTEWIDGNNGINQITAIDVSSGSFTIDALNLANRVYNMLNRIAVSGGTYEDWQEAVYSTEALRRAETPIYMGGLSTEIVFEEVVSTAETEGNPLGTLAGKGTVTNKKGGHIEIKVDEPSYIMGIVSITPRVDYSQGNSWDMTELDTVDDLHKPALDGIGFQDLLQERMAWWGTYWDNTQQKFVKLAAGKIPAWLHYMTAVNECHGDFAEENKAMWMTLNRRYEYTERTATSRTKYGINDLTTYIDPTKYNYNFADKGLDAQNFWVQIGMKIECRRVMSARIMPQL